MNKLIGVWALIKDIVIPGFWFAHRVRQPDNGEGESDPADPVLIQPESSHSLTPRMRITTSQPGNSSRQRQPTRKQRPGSSAAERCSDVTAQGASTSRVPACPGYAPDWCAGIFSFRLWLGSLPIVTCLWLFLLGYLPIVTCLWLVWLGSLHVVTRHWLVWILQAIDQPCSSRWWGKYNTINIVLIVGLISYHCSYLYVGQVYHLGSV